MSIDYSKIPAISTDQMIEVDRLMIEEYGISLIQMMENAGRNLALLVKRLLNGTVSGKKVVVISGPGNNGGGGMVAARHLHNFGAEVTLLDVAKRSVSGVPAQQRSILDNMGIEIIKDQKALSAIKNCEPDAVVDAMVGYSISGPLRGLIKDMVLVLEKMDTLIVSLDVPTGVNAATGEVSAPCVSADATMTLALPKKGLFMSETKKNIGRLFLADISVPSSLYKNIGLDVGPLFAEYPIIELPI